jgi:biotin transport system substrate-specific component
MTAVTCVLAPLSLPIGPVPISLTNLAIYFALYILGMKKGTISYIVYLFIGLVGVPVFSGFTGGPAKLIGPTGGYLIGFVFMAMIAGIFIDKFKGKMVPSMVGMILGTLVCYGFGTAWLAYQGQMNFKAALLAGVIPFIPGDLIKMVLAAVFGPQIIKRLRRSELN